MNKAAAATGVALLGTAASVGGVYLSRKNSFDSVLPKDAKEFDEKGYEQGCVSGLFPSLKNLKSSNISTDGNGDSSTILGDNDKKDAQGCLVVNGKKENFENGSDIKGRGGFRFLGSIKNYENNRGVIVFAAAEPTNNNKFKGTGSAYAVQLSDSKEWEASHKLAIASEGKEVEVNGKFPKAKKINRQYWGYLEEPSGDMSKFCGSTDCTDPSKKEDTFFEGYWTGEGNGKSGSENVSDGMSNLSDWWKNTFGEDKAKIVDLVKNIKGKGTERVWYGINKSRVGSASSKSS